MESKKRGVFDFVDEESEGEDSEWSWGGKGNLKNGSMHYRFIVRGKEDKDDIVKIGDSVAINSGSASNPFIATVTDFYENLTDKQACANVLWLYRSDELAKWRLKLSKNTPPLYLPSPLHNEVYFTNHQGTVEIFSIMKTIKIQRLSQSTAHHKTTQNDPVARFKVDIDKKIISSLLASPTGNSDRNEVLKETENWNRVTPKSRSYVLSPHHQGSHSKIANTPTSSSRSESRAESTRSRLQGVARKSPKNMDSSPSLAVATASSPQLAALSTPSRNSKKLDYRSVLATTKPLPQFVSPTAHLKKCDGDSIKSTPPRRARSAIVSIIKCSPENWMGGSPAEKGDSEKPLPITKLVSKCKRKLSSTDICEMNFSDDDDDEDILTQSLLCNGALPSNPSPSTSTSSLSSRNNPTPTSSSGKDAPPTDSSPSTQTDHRSLPRKKGGKVATPNSPTLDCHLPSPDHTPSPSTLSPPLQVRSSRRKGVASIRGGTPRTPALRTGSTRSKRARVSFRDDDLKEAGNDREATSHAHLTPPTSSSRASKRVTTTDHTHLDTPLSSLRTTRSTRSLRNKTILASPATPTTSAGTSCTTPTKTSLATPTVSTRELTRTTRSTSRKLPTSKLLNFIGLDEDEDEENSKTGIYLPDQTEEMGREGEEEGEGEEGASSDEDDDEVIATDENDEGNKKVRTRKRLRGGKGRGRPRLLKRRHLLNSFGLEGDGKEEEREEDEEERVAVSGTPRKRKKIELKMIIPDRKMILLKKACGRKNGFKQENKYEKARERLHASALPDSLPCREDEFSRICSFTEDHIINETGGCMYISGVPGTGKTATVREVIKYLQEAAAEESLPPFNFVEINGLSLTDPHQAYVSVWKQLSGEKATPNHASVLLGNYFSSSKKKPTTVLLVDELDMLWTTKQSVLYNLFDWPSMSHSHLVVLAVANTMDLPERVLLQKISSRMGLTRLSFSPYTFEQLEKIIRSRLEDLKLFEADAIKLAVRKVAAVSGDARRALDICRRATEIAQSEEAEKEEGRKKKKSSKENGVSVQHLQKAMVEMFTSSKFNAVKHLSRHQKLFMRAVMSEFQRSGVEEAKYEDVLDQVDILFRMEGIEPASASDLWTMCCRLGARHLLLLDDWRKGIHTRIKLNVNQDVLRHALT